MGDIAMTVIETTQALVNIPSVNPAYDPASPGEAGMTEWLIQWATEHHFACRTEEVFPNRKNVIIEFVNGAEHPHLLLNGHTDTVAIKDMTVPPFDAGIRDGRMWGRGTADMKGPVACMLHTLVALRERKASWQGTVTLALVVDEEAGFAGIRHFLKGSVNFDYAIVGEPTRFQVVRGCKGCLRFFIRAHGKAAHSSTPALGVSAITAMARAITGLETYFATELQQFAHPELGTSTGSIGLIEGGSGVNIVPDRCEIKVDIRLVPGQSWEATYARIQEIASVELPGIRWEFDPSPMVDFPFCLEAGHPLVQRSTSALGLPESEVVKFSCDASKIAAAGIPCIIFGPGDIGQAHTANESIAIEELERGVEDYIRIAEALLKP
jgi:acetylornithine deacetylase/succinyl-diaminopimelate desuccinylase family protein